MNKKLVKLLFSVFMLGLIVSGFEGYLSTKSNTSEQKLDGVTHTPSIESEFTDIRYATNSEMQKLDIYLPDEGKEPSLFLSKGNARFPVIMAIHGGGFVEGDKKEEDIIPMLQGLNHGYAVVAVNYRLSNEAKFPAAINDVKAAIRFIRVNAALYNLNPNKIALWGNSAGGNLASLAGTTGGTNKCYNTTLGNADVSDNVTAVVDWYGPINFSTIDEQTRRSGISEKVQDVASYDSDDSVLSKYLGQNISKVPNLCKQADPTTYITSECPPFLINHGKLDPIVPMQQSSDFASAIAKNTGQNKVTLILLEGAGHGGGKFEDDDNLAKMFAFLDKYMK